MVTGLLNTKTQSYFVFETAFGWIGVSASGKGITCLTLPQPTESDATKALNLDKSEWSPECFQDMAARLKEYFKGFNVDFSDSLDLSGATDFQRRVWEVTRSVPYGETRSYGWVAQQLCQPQAARGVGQALGQNPIPIIIPCHRIIGSDGKLHGFGGGLDLKRRLLDLEAGAKGLSTPK